MVAAQAAGCDPIVRGWRAGATAVPVHPDPQTIAVSIADETGGPASLRSIAASGGAAEAVSEAAILDAMRRLAGAGDRRRALLGDSVAGALALAARGELGPDEDVVCVLTGAGVKWPDALMDALTPKELVGREPGAGPRVDRRDGRRARAEVGPTLTPRSGSVRVPSGRPGSTCTSDDTHRLDAAARRAPTRENP